jgi:hypothetical protein
MELGRRFGLFVSSGSQIRSNKIKRTIAAVAGAIALLAVVTNALDLKTHTGFDPTKRRSLIPVRGNILGGGHGDPGLILISPGATLGTTYYDIQANGSTGNRIAVDQLGGVHYTWTKAIDPTLTTRHQYFGFISENGDTLPAVQLAGRNLSGFSSIGILKGAVNPNAANCAVVGYHNSGSVDDRFATDQSSGSGAFAIDSTGFPELPGQCIWPSFSIDINDNIQAVATQSDMTDGDLRYHIYSRKTYGSSFWSTPLVLDTTYTLSPVVTSSRLSARTAIVWTSPVFQDSNEYDNDIVYLESPDGISWNVSNIVNVTNYPASAQGDTVLRAYCDIDAVYDLNDNLHVIWNSSYVTRDTSNKMIVLYHSALFHWSAPTGIDVIYDHPVRDWPCDMGAWNLSVAKVSIGVDPDSNFLFSVFTRFDPFDYAYFDTVNGDLNPCGGDNAMPCANGELFMTWSTNSGNGWIQPLNITNSPSPGCLAGNCDSDIWSSMAEVVDDYAHIIYINDKDAGGAAYAEGDATDNPVLYYKIPNPTRTSGGGCQYVVGDINDNGQANGIDITFGVAYFKGGVAPSYICDCPNRGPIYAAGDVNGNCNFNGIDITYYVAYLKGGPALMPCPDCPPGL